MWGCFTIPLVIICYIVGAFIALFGGDPEEFFRDGVGVGIILVGLLILVIGGLICFGLKIVFW